MELLEMEPVTTDKHGHPNAFIPIRKNQNMTWIQPKLRFKGTGAGRDRQKTSNHADQPIINPYNCKKSV
jgi:hypothetical protein